MANLRRRIILSPSFLRFTKRQFKQGEPFSQAIRRRCNLPKTVEKVIDVIRNWIRFASRQAKEFLPSRKSFTCNGLCATSEILKGGLARATNPIGCLLSRGGPVSPRRNRNLGGRANRGPDGAPFYFVRTVFVTPACPELTERASRRRFCEPTSLRKLLRPRFVPSRRLAYGLFCGGGFETRDQSTAIITLLNWPLADAFEVAQAGEDLAHGWKFVVFRNPLRGEFAITVGDKHAAPAQPERRQRIVSQEGARSAT